jgi:predicted outer membrane repeat protein
LIAISTTFSNNRAAMDGGAISAEYTRFKSCTFLNNTAQNMGGAITDNGDVAAYTVVLGGRFEGNGASERGGAIAASGALDITNVNFIENTAVIGGAIYLTKEEGEEPSQLVGCDFSLNSATTDGGAVATDMPNDLLLSGCTFDSNTAAVSGAAVAAKSGFQGTLGIEECVFKRNAARSGSGGALSVAQNAAAKVEVSKSSFNSNEVRKLTGDF